MPMLEYTQKDHADTIQGRVMAGADLKQEGAFQIDIAHNGAGWAWSVNVEIGGKTMARSETESDHPHENLTWREATALAKTRVVELATELEAELERGGPTPTPPRNSEKEDSMDRETLDTSLEREDSPTQQPTAWERAKARVRDWVTPALTVNDPDYENSPHEDTRQAYEDYLISQEKASAVSRVDQARDQTVSPPQEQERHPLPPPPGAKWPILCSADAVSPGDIIEAAGGWYRTVVEVGEAYDPPEERGGLRPYGTAGDPGEQWQTAYCRPSTLPEIHAAQKAQREQWGEEHRLDVSTPGPTEAAGGSFQVFQSKAVAEQYAQAPPPVSGHPASTGSPLRPAPNGLVCGHIPAGTR